MIRWHIEIIYVRVQLVAVNLSTQHVVKAQAHSFEQKNNVLYFDGTNQIC